MPHTHSSTLARKDSITRLETSLVTDWCNVSSAALDLEPDALEGPVKAHRTGTSLQSADTPKHLSRLRLLIFVLAHRDKDRNKLRYLKARYVENKPCCPCARQYRCACPGLAGEPRLQIFCRTDPLPRTHSNDRTLDPPAAVMDGRAHVQICYRQPSSHLLHGLSQMK